MREFIIERFCDSEQMGVFGRLLINGVQVAYTVEQTWRENQPFISCIPAGRYQVESYESPKYGQTWALKNLNLDVGVYKGDALRYACLIHAANMASELKGCVAFGLDLGMIGREWAAIKSKDITRSIISQIKPDDQITIIWKDHP